jgi:hypothetical protein
VERWPHRACDACPLPGDTRQPEEVVRARWHGLRLALRPSRVADGRTDNLTSAFGRRGFTWNEIPWEQANSARGGLNRLATSEPKFAAVWRNLMVPPLPGAAERTWPRTTC